MPDGRLKYVRRKARAKLLEDRPVRTDGPFSSEVSGPTQGSGGLAGLLAKYSTGGAAVATFTRDAPYSSHYREKGNVEPIHLIESQHLPFHLANVVKYVCRHGMKDGMKDLEKARWYLDRYISMHVSDTESVRK